MGLSHLAEMAERMSWSKRQDNIDVPFCVNVARYCDWITAIDFDRCESFVSSLGKPNVKELVVKHCHEKLLLIRDELPEPYKSYATPLHNKLLERL